MPQQPWAGSVTSTPLRSRTATAARPMAGALYSTLHVANSAIFLAPRTTAVLGRELNQLEKVGRWKRGSLRLRWIPTIHCMKARCTPSSLSQLESGAPSEPSLPTSAVLPSILS